MIEITTTNITASTISEIFYIPDVNGNLDVYIPITASSISDESSVTLIGEDVESWCHNVSLMYAIYQPQGNVWFLHLTLDRYDYSEDQPELKDRTVGLHIELFTKESYEPIIIDHQVIQNGCERDESETCEFAFCLEISGCEFSISQDCTLTDGIIDEYGGTKTHVLTQEC
jgi:hypothetical protein